jgi:hypothetical protein
MKDIDISALALLNGASANEIEKNSLDILFFLTLL